MKEFDVSNLTLEEIEELRGKLWERAKELEPKPPSWKIQDDKDAVAISSCISHDPAEHIHIAISVSTESLKKHRDLWRDYHISHENVPEDFVDVVMDSKFYNFVIGNLRNFFSEEKPFSTKAYPSLESEEL